MAIILSFPGISHADLPLECGTLENPYGPYDYTKPYDFTEKLPIVEQGHFPRYVENLERGKTGSIAHDLDYTLRAFPNHHRALYAMVRYSLKKNTGTKKKPRYSMDCYFLRAITFAPHDGKIYLIRGIYYFKQKKWNKALQSFEKAAEMLPNHSEVYYNLGLTYLKLKKIDQAQQMASRAYQLGYPMPGLREALKKYGRKVVLK